ncbi:MAG: NAD-dependent epimerase/dehydratase family protein, partial [Ignavibacteriae bacterium]|nr:NAD-dependent epimerase/dehydratase family protein [Ignavibacteriota bacterium]
FGPQQNPFSEYSAVIPKFINAMLEGRKPVIYGDGLQSRDFSYIANVVEANILATVVKESNGNVFNIACQEAHSLLDLIQVLNDILGTNVQPEFLPERKGDVKHSLADISLARNVLHYAPKVNWEEGLIRTVGWYRKQRG